jgi:hypothetical protein
MNTKNKISHIKANGGNYITARVNILGNTFAITEVTDAFNIPLNYISVRKETNNPFNGPGRTFKDFDQATRAYKSPAMKTALLMAEIDIKAFKATQCNSQTF